MNIQNLAKNSTKYVLFLPLTNAYFLEMVEIKATLLHTWKLCLLETYLFTQKNEPIWDQIIKIKNRDQLGFLNFYYKTKDKQKYIEELDFFVLGLYKIFDTERNQNNDQINIRQHIAIITKYPYIKLINVINNDIPVLSVEKLLSFSPQLYASYSNYLINLHETIKNEIYKEGVNLSTDFLESIITQKPDYNSKQLISQMASLQKFVANMKDIDNVLYKNLSVDNTYECFCEIEKNADNYINISVSCSNKHKLREVWKDNQDFIFRVIRLDIQTAFDKLSQEEKDILSEGILKAFYS